MSPGRALLAVAIALGLGCGGGGPVSPVLDPWCEAGSWGALASLAPVDLPAEAPSDGVDVAVVADGTTQPPLELALSRLPAGPVNLGVDQAAPAGKVADALRLLEQSGRTDVRLIAESRDPWDLPPYADPALATELEELLSRQDPAERAILLSQRLSDEVRLCPGAVSVFSAISAADPSQKCWILSHGLDEALPSCPLTSRDRVATYVQVAARPDAHRPVALRWDPAGPALEVDDEPWGAIAKGWAEHPPSALRRREPR